MNPAKEEEQSNDNNETPEFPESQIVTEPNPHRLPQVNLQQEPNELVSSGLVSLESNLGTINPGQVQQQFMAQMLQLSQQQQLMQLQQGLALFQMNLPQAFSSITNSQQMNQLLLSLGGNMNTIQGASFPLVNQNLNISPGAAASGTASTTDAQQMNQLLLSLGGNTNTAQGASFPHVNQNLNISPVAAAAGTVDSSPKQDGATGYIAGDTRSDETGWKEQFQALLRYRLVNGHTKVPSRYKDNERLGRWVMTQRRQMALMVAGNPNSLTPERISMLNSIGFSWSVRPEPRTTWETRMSELEQYKATYGNTLVPQRIPTNPKLGTWVHTQRRQFQLMREGKKSSMTQQKIDALNAVGFVWSTRSKHNDDGGSSGGEDGNESGGDSNDIEARARSVKTEDEDEKKISSCSKGDSPPPPTSA